MLLEIPGAMQIEVKLFAAAKAAANAETVRVDLPESATVADLRTALRDRFPSLDRLLQHTLFAVDREYANDATPLRAQAEVACIPPVSGG